MAHDSPKCPSKYYLPTRTLEGMEYLGEYFEKIFDSLSFPPSLPQKYASSNMSYFEKIDNVWANFFGVDIPSTTYDHLYINPHDPFPAPKRNSKPTSPNVNFRGRERIGETEDGKKVYQVKKGKNVKAVGFKIPYSDGLWTHGSALVCL